jgi:thioredoxin reductase
VSTTDQILDEYEVVVVGGGAAGLSAALVLGRSRRSVLVLDSGQPRNAPAAGVHGLLTRDGISPAEFVAIGRKEVRGYGGHLLLDVEAKTVTGDVDNGFVIGTSDGREVRARRVLITTGLTDELPDIPGVREQWGTGVLHCPYCHGWEVRDQAIGILAVTEQAAHQALLFRQWSEDVTLFLNDSMRPTDEEAGQLAALGVQVVEGKVVAVESTAGRLTGLRLADGTVCERQAVVIMPRFVARADFLVDLGLTLTDHPKGAGQFIEADETGLTDVPGVYVAGNAANLMAQVGAAAAGGAVAAAAINMELVTDDARKAVAAAG